MTPAEYTSAERFPLTTQPGLPVQKQLLIDAFNLDGLRGWAEDNPLTDEQRELLTELELKAAVASAVRVTLNGADEAHPPTGENGIL